jgi:hypothetical protein
MDRWFYLFILGAFVPQAGLPDLVRASINVRAVEEQEENEAEKGSEKGSKSENPSASFSMPVEMADFRPGQLGNYRTLRMPVGPERLLSLENAPFLSDFGLRPTVFSTFWAGLGGSEVLKTPRNRFPEVMIHGPPAA